MSDDRIKELFEKHAGFQVCGYTKTHCMGPMEFAAALREALAEELGEAVRLLEPMAEVGAMRPAYWPDSHEVLGGINKAFTLRDCRAAARFVVEHGKKGA